LRSVGWIIVSPAELDDPIDRELALTDKPSRKTWGDFLARDIKLIADGGIEAIIFLPYWYNSRGARLEAMVGLLTPKFSFFQYDDRLVYPLNARMVMNHIAAQVQDASN
jgi:Domain of unknown function (DUF4406)